MGHNDESEANLQDSSAQPSLPEDGLRILARLIVRHHQKSRQELEPVDSKEEGTPYADLH